MRFKDLLAEKIEYVEPFYGDGDPTKEYPVAVNPSRVEFERIRKTAPKGVVRWMYYKPDNEFTVWDASKLIHADIYVTMYGHDEMDTPDPNEFIGGRTTMDGVTLFDGDFGGENRGTFKQDVRTMESVPQFTRLFPNIEWKRS